jgi:hypothetical protein
MKVIGIDPAPSYGAQVFEDECGDGRMDTRDLVAKLESWRGDPGVLLCWDAPLTGPADPNCAAGYDCEFTKRPVERFFGKKSGPWQTPKGISVLGYASCQHWTISRHVLGLPRVGRWDAQHSELPFELLTEGVPPPEGTYVVEVHPALALWLWCRDELKCREWPYKDKKGSKFFDVLWKTVCDRIGGISRGVLETIQAPGRPKNHDELDARVAWALGRLWIDGQGGVEILGDHKLGAFLLPVSAELKEKFEHFQAKTSDR